VDKFTIFRDETTTALAGFHGGPLSWSNWNFNNQEKIPQNKTTNNKLNHIILWHWTGIEPGLHWWEASIQPLPLPCFSENFGQKRKMASYMLDYTCTVMQKGKVNGKKGL